MSKVEKIMQIINSQAQQRAMSVEEIKQLASELEQIYKFLEEGETQDQTQGQTQGHYTTQIQTKTQQEIPGQATIPAVDPHKSITEKDVTCLECGKKFKMLSTKHLRSHGLDHASYKQKWGIHPDTSLVAKELSKLRQKQMQEKQIWEKRKMVQEKEDENKQNVNNASQDFKKVQ